MENAPLDTSEASKEKPSDKKKRRKSFEIGKAVIDMDEPKPEIRPEPIAPIKNEKSDEGWLARFTERAEKTLEEPESSAEELEEEDETVSEAEAPSDGTLSQVEKETVIHAIAQEASQNLPDYDAEDDPEEAAADILLADFYDKLDSNPDIEAAANEIIEAAGIELSEEKDSEIPPEADNEAAPVPGWDEELVFDRSAEALPFDLEDEEDPAIAGSGTPAGAATGVPGAGGAVPPAGRGLGPGHGVGGGPGAGGPGMPHGPTGHFGGGPPAIPGFHYAPPAPSAPNRPARTESIDNRANPAVFFVAGGIIGYLIGRRRGRIKTEKKLLPVQKKLEKQVEDLHWEIKAKETKIRKIAAEKVKQEGPAVVEALAANRAAKPEKRTETVLPLRPEAIASSRHKAPEANLLHGAKAHEHLAHMLMTAESIPAAVLPKMEQSPSSKPGKVEIKQSAEQAKPPVLTEKSAETLNRSQLLQLSEQIIVDGTSLRQIYETNLVGERGLRRLVTEHLRGGDLSKALRNEVVEREIDFERDPVMRDIAPVGSTPTGSGGAGGTDSTPTLNQMLEKAAAALPASDEEAAFYKARAAYEADMSNKQRQHQKLVDISFATIILTLLGAVIYLFITRG